MNRQQIAGELVRIARNMMAISPRRRKPPTTQAFLELGYIRDKSLEKFLAPYRSSDSEWDELVMTVEITDPEFEEYEIASAYIHSRGKEKKKLSQSDAYNLGKFREVREEVKDRVNQAVSGGEI